MAEGNIPGSDRNDSCYCIYCPEMLKTYQSKTKFFQFPGDANTEELKIKNNITFQWLHCNDFVAIVFASHACLCLQTKLSPFLTTGYLGKYRPVVKDFQANKNADELFHNGYWAMVLNINPKPNLFQTLNVNFNIWKP